MAGLNEGIDFSRTAAQKTSHRYLSLFILAEIYRRSLPESIKPGNIEHASTRQNQRIMFDLMSRLIISLYKSLAETGHFQGGVKFPLDASLRSADPLRGTSPHPSNSPPVMRLSSFSIVERIYETYN
jgi:hypothetical protein